MFNLVNRSKGFFNDVEMDKIFDALSANFGDTFSDNRYMKDGDLYHEIECPGFNKENLSVELVENILTVQGERGEGKHKREIYKRFAIGTAETVEAEVKDGILTLVFKAPKKKVTKLEIK